MWPQPSEVVFAVRDSTDRAEVWPSAKKLLDDIKARLKVTRFANYHTSDKTGSSGGYAIALFDYPSPGRMIWRSRSVSALSFFPSRPSAREKPASCLLGVSEAAVAKS
jgi:hypothetical protein